MKKYWIPYWVCVAVMWGIVVMSCSTPAPAQVVLRQTTTVTVCTGELWYCDYARFRLDKNGRRKPVQCLDNESSRHTLACQMDKEQIEREKRAKQQKEQPK